MYHVYVGVPKPPPPVVLNVKLPPTQIVVSGIIGVTKNGSELTLTIVCTTAL